MRQRPSVAQPDVSVDRQRGEGVYQRSIDGIRRLNALGYGAPGSGLGLSIVDELSRAYGGTLRLGEARLGGLLVEMDLPRAEA